MPAVRISKRWVLVSSAVLAVGSLGALGALVVDMQRTLARQQGDLASLTVLTERQAAELVEIEDRLGRVGRDLLDVRDLEAEARERLLVQIESRTGSEAEAVRRELDTLESRVGALRSAADEHARLLAAARANEDVEVRYRELMSPTVRINARHEVGSGTIWWSRGVGDGRARTFIITAWHIVQQDGSQPIEVDFYEDGDILRSERGRVVAKEPDLDLALIEVRGHHVYPQRARLPLTEDLAGMRIFSEVYAIGCPLGYSPLPTSGELTSKAKMLDGRSYWMINAPTIFGNSGGGIYMAQTRTMIGVLSRISAYKNMIDVAVPHMGLVTPVDQVYEWLERTRYPFVYRDRLAEVREARNQARTLEASSPSERRLTDGAVKPSADALQSKSESPKTAPHAREDAPAEERAVAPAGPQ